MKDNVLFLLAVAFAVVASAVRAGDDVETPMTAEARAKQAEKAEEGEATPKKGCKSVHSCWCNWYQRKWGDVPNDSLEPLPQEKLDAISDEYIAQCKAIAKGNRNSSVALADLGEALLFRRRWDKARLAFTEALKHVPEKSYEAVWYRYRIAETWFGEGNQERSLAELVRAQAVGAPTTFRDKVDWGKLASDASKFLSGEELNTYRMPRDTGFKPFPEPQKATYSETFVPCPRIALKLTGVREKDARVALLTKKLEWRGFKWNVGGVGYQLNITLDAAAPVDKREGYTLEVKKSGASIRARDLQGILWGIISFLQVTDPVKHVARVCKVDDWPDTARRGYLGTALWAGCAEFTIFNKMNVAVILRHPLSNGADSPLNVFQCERLARELHNLGLEIEYGIKSWTMDMAWPYSWKKYLGMQIEICRRFAAMGAGVYYPNDDCRYMPGILRKEDLADGRKPSDFDAQHILDLFNGVREKYPEFRMSYCPPFYWGPDGRHPYPDDREKYLRSLQILPQEVGVYWTGGRVKSYKKDPSQVKWFTDLTGHKPTIFQNATGPHRLLSYVVDRTDWNAWHYPGFFEKDIGGYLKNAHTPTECPQITSLADCLWNVRAYDPERSIRRGMGNYAGDAFFNALDSVFADLCYIDKYEYGQLDASVRDEDIAAIEGRLSRIEKATAEAAAVNGQEFLDSCGVWMQAVGWFRNLVKTAKNPPDYKKVHRELLLRTQALAEIAGFDRRKGDVLLDAIDLHHSAPLAYGGPSPRDQLLASGIWGGGYADAKFKVATGTKKGNVTIVIRGATDIYPGGPKPEERLTLELNGKRIAECKNPFGREFSNASFKVPLSAFKSNAENHLKIMNGKDDRRLMVAFALIKFPGGEKTPADNLEESHEGSISLDE